MILVLEFDKRLLSTKGSEKFGMCNRLDFIFGAGGDGSGDVETLGRFEGGGGGVEGFTVGWIEAVRRTCSAWGLIVSLSCDEKGGGGEAKGFTEGWTEEV
jgi:hypothetical protein